MNTNNESITYKIKEGFVLRNILDEYIIVPVGEQAANNTYIMSVNGSGYLLWDMLEKGATKDEMTEKILDEYEIDRDTAVADIDKFLALLSEKSILE